MTIHATPGFWAEFAERCAGDTVGKASMSVREVKSMIAGIDPLALSALTDETRRYLPAVLAEIDTLHDAIARDHAAVTRAAILFAYATPNATLDHSIATAVALRDFDPRQFADAEFTSALVKALPSNRHIRHGRATFCAPLHTHMAARLHASWRMLASPETVTLPALEAIPYVGKKVARMAYAIANPSARIYTVDRWHCRQLLALSGREYAVEVGSWDTSYELIESFFTAWADMNFPGVPMWAIQWSAWNSCVARHRPHSFIWDHI